MPTIQRTCAHCRQLFAIRRNPAQRYCHQKACQQVRKNLWRQNQRAQDEDYRENQCQANRHWRKTHPDYWRHYRQTHPDYQQRNRELQNQRDRKRRTQRAAAQNPMLANSDAFIPNVPVKSGTYCLVPLTSPLANSDALQVEITVISSAYKNAACLQRDHLIAKEGSSGLGFRP